MWTSSVVPDSLKLNFKANVNGKLKQQTSTDDVIWSVKQSSLTFQGT